MGFLWQGRLLDIYDEVLCDGESYKTLPIMTGLMATGNQGVKYNIEWNNFYRNTDNVNERWGFYVTADGGYNGISTVGAVCQSDVAPVVYPEGSYNYCKYGCIGFEDTSYYPPTHSNTDYVQGVTSWWGEATTTFTTNVPIFLTKAELQQYIWVGDNIKDAINYGGVEVPETTEYFYYGVANEITVDEYGISTPTASGVLHRGCKIKSSGNVSLYEIEGISDGILKFGINLEHSETPLICYYSNDTDIYGNGTWQNMPGQPYYLPFDYLYREWKNEVGTFYCSGKYGNKKFNTNMFIFRNKADSDAYNETGEGGYKAINYSEVVNGKEIENPTGVEEDETTFGENLTRQFFTQCYLCTQSNMIEISNDLFDYDVTTLSGLWDDIKKGLEMYGTNPMDVVQGIRYYPFDVSSIFTDISSQQYLYFGAYQLQLQSSVYRVIHPNGYKDLGTVTIRRTFNDWRDFEPYTKLSIYLPYIGRYPLEASKYYGKEVNIRYYIDIRTGMCCACLIANGILLDWFDGQIGTEMPITLTDYSSYSQTQINTILRNAAVGVGATGAVGNIGLKSVANAQKLASGAEEAQADPLGSSLEAQTMTKGGVTARAVGTLGAMALVGTGSIMKTCYDVMKTGTAAFTSSKGSSSSMINSFLPQYPTFMFEILEIDESPYLNELYGRPSNASGRIGDFSGYLEAEEVMLICPIATDSERQEIIDLVRSGIYI